MKLDSNRWLRGAGIAGLAFSALVAGITWAADKEAPKADKRKIVIQSGEGPADVFVWEGDAEAPEVVSLSGGPWLGVTLAGEKEGGGARITSVIEESPAAKAGLKKGDVVVSMNGDRVAGPATLTEMIHAAKAGDSVRFEVMRDGKSQSVTAELAERKARFRVIAPGFEGAWSAEDARRLAEDASRMAEQYRALELEQLPELGRMRVMLGGGPRLGVELVRTTPELRAHLGAPEDHGVLVGKVLPGSAAEKAGIKVGDVITRVDGSEVSSAGGIVELISGKAGQGIDLEVVRDRKTVKVRAEIPKREDDAPAGPRAYRLATPPVAPVPPVPPAAPAPPAPSAWTSWSITL